MSKPTNDFRLVINDFVDRMLDAEARGTRNDKQAVAREVLEVWARERHRVHRLYAKSLRADGLQMELDGLDTEEDGARRK